MTSNSIPPLAQLAQNMRRMNLCETADLIDRECAALVEQFGPLTEWRVSPRAAPSWLGNYVGTLRMHCAYHERLGDLANALGFALAVSVLAQGVSQGAALTPQVAQGLTDRVRRTVAQSFERINGSREAEYNAARFVAEQRWQQSKRSALGQQARQDQLAQLSAVKTALETALAS